MATPTIAEYIKYANLQMAAEAFLYDEALSKLKTGDDLKRALTTGNEHASRFTETQAKEFLDNRGQTTVYNAH